MNKFQKGQKVIITQAVSDAVVGYIGIVTDIKDGDYYQLDDGQFYYKENCLEAYNDKTQPMLIDRRTYDALKRLGILDTSVRSYNRGASDYSQHIIQPWSIWQDWNLNPWDADIVKRVLRTKKGDARKLDYEKIIHICEERIRQLNSETE